MAISSGPKKTAAARKPIALDTPDDAPPLEDMPPAPEKKPKSEHLFIAWKGLVHDMGQADERVEIVDLRVFGRKDQCTEFAVDQEPAWKWVQTAKGESLKDAILAKAAGR